ncbi:MAG: hypothetical protein DRP11_03460 [Candidatus Aenigmatarchaeota archaeon]|nr:MAG: hypothetical protein DRP11_03460 [Candidatus Aenigmarchaeota archaeon]
MATYRYPLEYDSRIEKALERLRQMGLKVHVYSENPDTAFIFITLESIFGLIKRQIKYPNKEIYYEEPYVVIKVWRES